MKEVVDNFSTGAAEYALYRPLAPAELFDFLYSHLTNFDAAWDCGTGNGQVAAKLAERFTTVYGTDISAEQLSHAQRKENIIYKKERAEETSIGDSSIDLMTVAQAIHWFDFDSFYSEVRRVARPNAILAAWAYDVFRSTPQIDSIVDHLHNDILGIYWGNENRMIDAGYRTIPFPFREIPAPELTVVRHFTLEEMEGYFYTWSAVKKYMNMEGRDPVLPVIAQLREVWASNTILEIRWPLHIRCGRVE